MTFARLSVLAAVAVAFSASATAQDLDFTLYNKSSYDVVEFYASPSNVGDWEEDILGADILPSGDSVRITIADGRTQCEYDLRYVFEDGDVVDDAGIDLCDTGSYTLTD